jgi:transposase
VQGNVIQRWLLNQLFMSATRYSVGVDISSDKFHAALLITDVERKHKVQRSGTFDNNTSGIQRFVKWCQQEHKQKDLPFAIVMEATSTYHERVALALHLADFCVHIVLPNRAKAYINSFSSGSKTDKADARALARMCAEQNLTRWNPPGDFYYTLRMLTRYYQTIQEQITANKNQLHALQAAMKPMDAVSVSMQELISIMETQLKGMKDAIHRHLRSDKAIWKRIKHVVTIPGVGFLTAAVVLAETGGFELFNSVGQLVSYAGYDVIENQSGKHVGKTRISKRGNNRIRRGMHMCSLTTITSRTPTMVDLYDRTMERHGIKMKSYVAIQKKLLILIYTLWKKEEDFDPNFQQTIPVQKEETKNNEEETATSDKEAVHSSRDSEPDKTDSSRKKLAPTKQG